MIDKKCCEDVTHSKVKIEENGKQVVFLNKDKNTITKVRVDGCVLINKTACDWWIKKNDIDASVLVELKGCDVEHALEQIEATFRFLSNSQCLLKRNAAIIVCSKPSRHPSFTTKLQKAKNNLSSQYKAPLHIVTGNHEFEIEKVLLFKGPF
ncbi:MAG: hypothetical protein RLZZ495_205 [Pseudomonadota bacterium]|jgi:hypothetical protein